MVKHAPDSGARSFLCSKALPMAEGAFALSPLSASARATAPTDADYEAIREAFMETARGRWFLGEYAKRNRNADTAMVLEAVARIEQSIAAVKTEEVMAEPPSPDPARDALRDARSSVEGVLSDSLFENALGQWRRSSRIIHEIAWALRESGADTRICDILDSQVRSIETACDEFSGFDVRSQVLAILDAALQQITPDAEAAGVPEAVHTTDKTELADSAVIEPATENFAMPAMSVEAAPDERLCTVSSQPEPEAAAYDHSAAEPALTVVAEAAEATASEAVLEDAPEPEVAPGPEAARLTATPLPEPTHPPVRDAAPEPGPSLGESLIAQGVVKHPLSGRADPLASIRRLSQAEKIAFFS